MRVLKFFDIIEPQSSLQANEGNCFGHGKILGESLS
jgi:hypothetical protein